MSNYYSSGYGNQQQPGGDGGFYNAGGYGHQQQQQQTSESQTTFQGQGQQWQQQPQQQQQSTNSSASQWPSQQQQQQQSTQPSIWTPSAATAATVMSAAAGGLNEDTVRKLWESSWARMIPGLESTMNVLRVYFAVDNRYVKRKMQKILCPFLSKNWTRMQSEPMGPEMKIEYSLPHSDENAPDLYIPSMSFITYVLLCGLCYGTAGQFEPEVLSQVAWWCFATQVVEVLGIRFGMYALQAPVAILDLFCYTGYKYLGLCVNLLVGMAAGYLGKGQKGYYVAFLWTATAASFFMLKTMANNIPMNTASTGPKREVMVCAFAASQFATMWFVSQTKFLD